MNDAYELAAETETALIFGIQQRLDETLTKHHIRRTSTPLSERQLTPNNFTNLGDSYEKWRYYLENSIYLPKVRGTNIRPKGIISGNLIQFTDRRKRVQIEMCDVNPANQRLNSVLDLDIIKNLRSPLGSKCKFLLRQTVQLFHGQRKQNKCNKCFKKCKCRLNFSV